LRSISNEKRKSLLKGALAVLYTPENEHFGIVPCEAMYCNVPVLADNSGGPVESIGNSKCGYLIDGGREEWMKKMKEVLERGKKPTQGKERMKEKFGF
jgi:alpha-1,3/alpha-1,6-mannosyltransferase